jgi:hypothetical protein
MERSLDALLEFLDWLASKGLMAKNTAFGRKAACSAVLGILDPEEREDVTQMDMDHVMARFTTLQGKKYAPKSLKVYRGRVQNSIDDFTRYKSDPENFKVQFNSSKSTEPTKLPKRTKMARNSPTPAPEPTQPQSSGSSPNVYPIPIRADLVVRIHGLPFDLTKAEAEKIANVVRAMAILE